MAKKSKTKRRRRRGIRSVELTAEEGVEFLTGLTKRFLVGVFSDDRKQPGIEHLRRLAVGALGGLVYAVVKNYLSQGTGIVEILWMEPGMRQQDLMVGYWAAPAISALVGGAVAWISQVKSNRLLLLMGIGGMIIFQHLVPTGDSQLKKGSDHSGWLSISTAYAENDDKCVGDSAFAKGFKAFFGTQDRYDRYAVVIASGKNHSDAEAKLKKLKAQYPNLNLRLGLRACDNNFYPVYASEYLPINDAKRILNQVKKLDSSTSDAYLSAGPKDADEN